MNSIDSIFEVKSINKEGFELYNLVNEKTYKANSQIKMVNYRRVFKGNFLVCKLIKNEKDWLLSNIQSVVPTTRVIEAYRAAVSMQMKNPELLYADNKEKHKEIKENVKVLGGKYKEFFKTEEVYTTKENINGLLAVFNDFVEGGEKADYEEFTESEEKAEVIVSFDEKKGLITTSKGKQEDDSGKEFSVTTILYSSNAFEKLMELSEQSSKPLQGKEQKIGRNDLCICGSGKKYKKCCMQ